MKKGFYLLPLFLLLHWLAYAQNFTEYDKLVKERKYYTAWQWLEKQDPENKKPEVFIRKANHVMDYFAVSMMHQMFGLKDLEPGEDLMQLRRDMAGTHSMVMLDIPTVADELLKTAPKNAKLHRLKGQYYFDVYLKYGDGAGVPAEEQLRLATQSFKESIKLGDKFGFSHYVLGYAQLINNDMDGAALEFLQSIALDPNYPSAQYNLSYLYIKQEKWDKAREMATTAAKLYTDSIYKADAYRLAGISANELKDYDGAISLLKQSLAYDVHPASYNHLINAAYGKKDKALVKGYTLALLKLDPTDQQSYEDLLEIYAANETLQDFIVLLEELTKDYKEEPKTLTLIYMYLAYASEDLKLDADALKYMKLTYESAKQFMPADNEFIIGIQKEIAKRSEGK